MGFSFPQMAISTSVSRLAVYYARHGLGATFRRTSLALTRGVFSNRMVVFYCDLASVSPAVVSIPDSLTVRRQRGLVELGELELHELTAFWNPTVALRNIKERFAQGANLWIIKSDGQLAGFGWTLKGRTIEPHYVRLGPEDVHLFDFHVFPQFRGLGLNPVLVKAILRTLAQESAGRAFIEAAEWNKPQLSSLTKTPFQKLGLARKFTLLGRTTVRWQGAKAVEKVINSATGGD